MAALAGVRLTASPTSILGHLEKMVALSLSRKQRWDVDTAHAQEHLLPTAPEAAPTFDRYTVGIGEDRPSVLRTGSARQPARSDARRRAPLPFHRSLRLPACLPCFWPDG